jgi:hypothetical protein
MHLLIQCAWLSPVLFDKQHQDGVLRVAAQSDHGPPSRSHPETNPRQEHSAWKHNVGTLFLRIVKQMKLKLCTFLHQKKKKKTKEIVLRTIKYIINSLYLMPTNQISARAYLFIP